MNTSIPPSDVCGRVRGLKVLLRLALAGMLLLTVRSAEAAPPEGFDLFENKIRPLFVEQCQKCHGPEKQWSSLRLDSRAAALTGGDNGPALVAGNPDESELVLRIASTDDDLRMPPPKEGKPLSAEQIATIRKWIKIGAPWPESNLPQQNDKEKLRREHWAFQPIQRVEPPAVQSRERIKNAVDQFVFQKLDGAGLALAPEADRHTLIRRATYDLTGLPPTPDEVAAFIHDNNADAYERLIDRLLASPRYGEQWGRYWLDIARYSDTKGYVYAREERFFIHASRYRDWVIRAFNEDLPYDRFVQLQLAADQVAPDEPEQLAAMGFLTLGRRMLGVTPDIIEDRIDVVCRGLLGLTVGCARCHDHKYDPIPTADYYSLYGVFENCVERNVAITQAGETGKGSDKFAAELRKRQKALDDLLALRRQEASDRVRSRLPEYLAAQWKLADYPDLGIIAVAEQAEVLPGFVRRWEAYLKAAAKRADPVFVAWTAYAKLPADKFVTDVAEATRQLLSDPEKINPRVAEAFAKPPASRSEMAQRYATLFAEVDAKWKAACDAAKAAGAAPPQALPNPADEALRQVLFGDGSPCIVPNEPVINTEYLWDIKTVEELWKLQNKVDQWLLQHPTEASCAVVLNDRTNIVEPQIFRRGNPMTKADAVPLQFLEVIAGPKRRPFQQGSGRLEMARAIVDPENPFTSRVWVNRVWLQHFGAGLVTTPSDFGIRSAPPSHPELLDWLASEFTQHGWSTKWLHRTIMLSATYRQSSKPLSEAAAIAVAQERDPDNRLLWRMNPRRLSFEQFRDTLLALSGELDTTMGGHGVDLLSFRRSVYTLVDRQYLPSVFNVFDFANPDFHLSQRAETTTSLQALFALNSTYLADRARMIATHIQQQASTPEAQAVRAYNIVFKRDPTPDEVRIAVQFLADAKADATAETYADVSKAWSYGYGEVDVKSGRPKSFNPLPHFTGSSWQGGVLWPDSRLGWIKLTAKGGHTGDDSAHAAIRRWTATAPGTIAIKSEIAHQNSAGDGVRCWIALSKKGTLKRASVYNNRKQLNVDSLEVEPDDTIDFIVDCGKTLDSDEFVWTPTITLSAPPTTGGASSSVQPGATWGSEENFTRVKLLPLEQLAQMLLASNELMFVD